MMNEKVNKRCKRDCRLKQLISKHGLVKEDCESAENYAKIGQGQWTNREKQWNVAHKLLQPMLTYNNFM